MNIVAIRSYGKKMALKKPYTIAYNTFSDVHIAFLEIELSNGIVGIGSGSPAEDVVGETTEQTLGNLESDFVAKLKGRDIREFQQIIYEATIEYAKYPGTLAAIDLALHDAFTKYIGISVAEFYGIKTPMLPTSYTIGIKSVAKTLEDAKEIKEAGFTVLKVKTGLNVEEDIERVVKLKETYGSYFTVRVDANQGYGLKETKQFLDATKKYELELMEQPVKVGEEKVLLELAAEERALLVGDESLKNPAAALKFAGNKTFGIYNIKLMKCGGLIGARQIATIAEQADIELFWGCNDESIISITAALHVAYTCPNTKYLDLDGSFDLAEDLVKGGFELKNGKMYINQQPGFGFDKL
ncbi:MULTISPECIES: mandelate racemase/muconate lactonizing enzyme family protein [unclassified Paraflavitalea]|uniref:mandelate racemase/muconate lactonizing enzyme family protein n=1 Tax=unclassified Paraflavitalea TaxID=2798305 RepID=UPI003D334FB2